MLKRYLTTLSLVISLIASGSAEAAYNYTSLSGSLAYLSNDIIYAVARYNNDANSNNSVKIEYKKNTDSIWTLVTGPTHMANGASSSISDLNGGTSYDIRFTFTDIDGVVTGIYTNPQIVTGIVTPSNATTAGTATASVDADSGAIVVTMPYQVDYNKNSTYTVEYKKAADPSFTTWVTGAPHSASPYIGAITGLIGNTNYSVKLTYVDPDGVNGTQVQIIDNLITPGDQMGAWVSASEGASDNSMRLAVQRLVDMNNNGSVTSMKYRKKGSGNWSDFPTPVVAGRSTYSTVSGVTYDSAYELEVQLSDPDGVIGSTIWSETFTPRKYIPSVMLHNSTNIGTARWGATAAYSAGWGLPGTRYGTFTCGTCHNPQTANRYMVTEAIDSGKARALADSPIRDRGIMGDDYSRSSDTARICETCHTVTRVHRRSPVAQVYLDHENSTNCVDCHTHDKGFRPSCVNCHGTGDPYFGGIP